MPPQLISKVKKGKKFQENYGIPNTNYEEIHFSQWGKISNNKYSKELPTRLYNIQTSKTEKTENNSNINSYAIVSYVWGNPVNQTLPELKDYAWKEGLNISGNKALYKAIKTCKHLDINHLWIDQLCIDQNNPTEKAQEVGKMRQYYTNANYTLISINTELGDISNVDLMDILKLVTRSEWFTRSWTYQEGWLSKHTIFMFDDKLIDGRAMAGAWALNQISYANEGKYNSRSEFNKGTKKIATPIGWTYYRDGYDENDKVEMTLSQALKEIKHRGRGIPIDGIYSMLGLLPYGEHVPVKYKDNLCKECKKKESEQMQSIICEHPEEQRTEWPTYFQEDLEKALYEVMKVAAKNDYAEPIAWYGISNKSWMPQINEHGSTSIEGGIDIRIKNSLNAGIYFEKEGIKLYNIPIFIIEEVSSDIHKLEEGFEIESGLYRKEVGIKKIEKDFFKDKNTFADEIIETSLLGTQLTLDLAEKGKVLVVFNREYWRSNKTFALLVEDSEKNMDLWKVPVYHRLGLIELSNEKIQESNGSDVIISINSSYEQTEQDQEEEFQAQIEVSSPNEIDCKTQ